MLEFTQLTSGPETVLCLPGLECSRAAIGEVAKVIDGDARLLWADFNRVAGLTYPRAVEWLQAAVERERPAVITAESFGSTIALSWALEHPENQIPLVLSGPFSHVRRRRFTSGGWLAAKWVPPVVQPLCVWVGGQYVIERRIARPLRQQVIRDLSRIPRHAWLDRLAMMLEVDLRPRLGEIKVPMTLLWGEEDNLVFPAEEAEEFRAAGHDDAIDILPNIGHSVWTQAPQRIADDIRGLFKAQRESPRPQEACVACSP